MIAIDTLPRVSPAFAKLTRILSEIPQPCLDAVIPSIDPNRPPEKIQCFFSEITQITECYEYFRITCNCGSCLIRCGSNLIDDICDFVIPGWKLEKSLPREWLIIHAISHIIRPVKEIYDDITISPIPSSSETNISKEICSILGFLLFQEKKYGFQIAPDEIWIQKLISQIQRPHSTLKFINPGFTTAISLGAVTVSANELKRVNVGDFVLLGDIAPTGIPARCIVPGLGHLSGVLNEHHFIPHQLTAKEQ